MADKQNGGVFGRPFVILIALALFGLSALGAVFGYYHFAVNRPLDFGEQPWVIQRGDTLGEVAAQLVRQDVIDTTLPLRLLARRDDLGRQIQVGEYRFPAGITLREFLRRIVNGEGRIGIKITIIEGWTFRDMREHLRRAPKLEQVAGTMTDRQLMTELGRPEWHPEGRFFPDTYYYTAGQTDLSVYRQAFRAMREALDSAWENRAEDLVLADKNEALVMASIIEKESWVADERREIAGVLHNRLKKGMRLQTDPTVIYGLGEAYRGRLTRAHLRADTPHNTYTRAGLPPTPISLPGRNSLEAAVQPARTNAYYFVAKGGGRHHFSETLEQHNRAVQKYLRDRDSDSG